MPRWFLKIETAQGREENEEHLENITARTASGAVLQASKKVRQLQKEAADEFHTVYITLRELHSN
jgi:hypothetical protein